MHTIKTFLVGLFFSAAAFSQCALVYNPFTNQWNCGGSGGTVGGASALSTPGSVPFVTSAGVLGQSANLFWDNANGRLGVGTNAPQRPAHIRNAGGLRIDTASSGFDLTNTNTGEWQITAVNSISRFGILGSLWTHSATGNVAIGTTTDDGTNRLQVAGGARLGGFTLDNGAAFGANDPIIVNSGVASVSTNFAFTQNALGQSVFNGSVIDFRTANVQRARFAATTGNLLLGTTTDGNFRLDVADSGSSGGLRVWDQRATIGSTSLVVRAGAGQIGAIQAWQDASGVAFATMTSAGVLAVSGSVSDANTQWVMGPNQADFKAAYLLRFSSTALHTGVKDLSLSRASAGVLQVGDGGANANGTVNAASASFSRATGAATVTTASGSADAYNTVQGNGAYINLYSILAAPYAGTQLNKSTNVNLWFTGLRGTDNYTWFTGSAYTSLASLSPGGTFTLCNEIPAIGSTSLVVRAGAGQTGNLQTWQNSSGTALAGIASTGFLSVPQVYLTGDWLNLRSTTADMASGYVFSWASTGSQSGTKDLSLSRASANTLQVGDGGANANGNINAAQYYASNGFYIAGGGTFSVAGTAMRFRSDSIAAFSSTTNATATLDLSLSRASANTLQVGDGSANSNGTILARIHTWANGTEGTCDATLRGQVVMVQGGAGVADTFRVCRKDAANAYAWTALY